MQLKFLVIRTPNPETLSRFYTKLGFTFEHHRHGSGPLHYSAATASGTVIEIYPLTKSQTEADKNLRLGFSLDHFESTIEQLRNNGVKFVSEPAQTDFGFMAVVEDPDGRKIELLKT